MAQQERCPKSSRPGLGSHDGLGIWKEVGQLFTRDRQTHVVQEKWKSLDLRNNGSALPALT
ncbi:MAG: hypothetical protein ACR2PG_13800 [Hyphomicrobiaceae bacterium]